MTLGAEEGKFSAMKTNCRADVGVSGHSLLGMEVDL